MPTLVQIGAGAIGRGFIAPTFAAAGWRIILVDIAPAVLAGLGSGGSYVVEEVDGSTARRVRVDVAAAIDGRDAQAVASALAAADLAATAIGLAGLPRLGPVLAAALRLRGRPLDVLVCENGLHAASDLRAAVAGADPGVDGRLGTVRASIGRMIPASPGAGLDVRAEPYAVLPVELAAFRGEPPQVPNLALRRDFDAVLHEKLYVHNLGHACLAYAGHLAGHRLIADCVADPRIAGPASAAVEEAVMAIRQRHGAEAGAHASRLADGLMRRYANRALGDTVARVARDPWRKLAADDRLVGAARLCLAGGIGPRAIAAHIGMASRYRPAADEPGAERWNAVPPRQRLLLAAGPAVDEALFALAGLDPAMHDADRSTVGHGAMDTIER